MLRQLYHFVSYLVQGLAGLLQLWPIFTLEIVSLWLHGWSWQALVLLPLGICVGLLLQGAITQNPMPLSPAAGRSTLHLVKFLGQFEHTRFTQLDNGTFLADVLGREEAERHFPEAFGRNTRGGGLTRGAFAGREKLRLVRLEDENHRDAHFPGSLVTYVNFSGVWVFLKSRAETMRGLEKYELLHELGHISGHALLRETIGSSVVLYATLLSLPILLLRAQDLLVVTLLLGVSLGLEFLRVRLGTRRYLELRLLDEIEADRFALARSRPEWFKRHAAREVAEALCRNASFSDEENEIRIQAFVSCLEAVRAGKPLPPAPATPGITSTWWEEAAFWAALAALVAAGFFYDAPSFLDVVAVGVWTVLALLTFAFAVRMTEYLEALTTVNISGVTRHDWVDEQVRSTKEYGLALSRWVKPGDGMVATYRLAGRYMGLLYKQEDAKATKHVGLAPETTGSLFAPSQVDIYLQRSLPPRAWIFYSKKIDLRIERLDYHPEKHWVRVHTADGPPLDLGVKIQWLVRPFWEDATEVTIARTENGETVESVTVPLRKVGTD